MAQARAVVVDADSPQEAAEIAKRDYWPGDDSEVTVSGPDEKVHKISLLGRLFG